MTAPEHRDWIDWVAYILTLIIVILLGCLLAKAVF